MARPPFFAGDPRAHEAFVELAEQQMRRDAAFRWSDLHALQDLRYFENEARRFHDGGGGRRFPGRGEFALRWNWTQYRVGKLLKTDWHDPNRPVPMEQLRAAHTPHRQVTARSPTGGQRVANAQTPRTNEESTGRQRRVGESSSRARSSNQSNQTTDPPPYPPPEGRGDDRPTSRQAANAQAVATVATRLVMDDERNGYDTASTIDGWLSGDQHTVDLWYEHLRSGCKVVQLSGSTKKQAFQGVPTGLRRREVAVGLKQAALALRARPDGHRDIRTTAANG